MPALHNKRPFRAFCSTKMSLKKNIAGNNERLNQKNNPKS